MLILSKLLLAVSFFLMSDRGGFWSADSISEYTEEMQNHKETPVDFETVKDQKVLLLVHGYNDSAQEALSTYQTIVEHIEPFDLYDTIIGYLWPGCDEGFEYFSAKTNTKKLAFRMQSHLQELSQKAAKLDALAHSMGNRLLLEALQLSPQRNVLIRNFYSLAPAVKDKDIELGRPFYPSVLQCEKMFVFHSDRDDVLKYDFFLAEHARALGYEGVDVVSKEPNNVQFVDCTEFVNGHSGYFEADPLYDFFNNQQANQTLNVMNVKLLVDGLVSKK